MDKNGYESEYESEEESNEDKIDVWKVNESLSSSNQQKLTQIKFSEDHLIYIFSVNIFFLDF